MKIRGKKSTAYYEFVLLILTMMWSMSFIWSKIVVNAGISPEMYLFTRYGMGALILLPFAVRDLKKITSEQLKAAMIMGGTLLIGMVFQVTGIVHTTPSNSSFITTAYVVIAPFTTWMILGQKPTKKIYAAMAICVIGIYILTMQPGEGLELNIGNLLTLISSFFWAVQLSYMSVASKKMSAYLLSFLSFVITSAGGLLMSFVTGAFAASSAGMFADAWPSILMAAIFPTVMAGVLQAMAQQHVDPNRAAIIYTMEAVFATVASLFLGLEAWRASIAIGGGIILAAVLISQKSQEPAVAGQEAAEGVTIDAEAAKVPADS